MAVTTDTDYRVGTASWTDPTLLATGFYPPRANTAEARLKYYAEHFRTVEVDSSFYALPSERNARLWTQRAPGDFDFNVKAFALLTGHAAETRALPKEIKALVGAEALRQPRIEKPGRAVLDLCFDMFSSAIAPLHEAGKLGCVLFQFPPWVKASPRNHEYIDFCRERLPDCRLAVEFRHPSWFGGKREATLGFLRDRNLSLVCIDAPAAPSIPETPYETTAEIAYVRLHGRNRDAWFRRGGTAADRYNYLYSESELKDCAARIRSLRGARTVYVLFNNCHEDKGVRNAITMRRLLE
jgi:uncharacterized protein YecE (DUF72 family)